MSAVKVIVVVIGLLTCTGKSNDWFSLFTCLNMVTPFSSHNSSEMMCVSYIMFIHDVPWTFHHYVNFIFYRYLSFTHMNTHVVVENGLSYASSKPCLGQIELFNLTMETHIVSFLLNVPM